jgi:hypothetical protein
MSRGRPFQPGNKFGRGRPRGSRNKTTEMAQQLLNRYAEPLMRQCIGMALKGDTKALQILIDRVAPARRDVPVKLGKLPTATAAEVSEASQKVIDQVAAGKLTATLAQVLTDLLEKRRRAIETVDLDERVRKLEARP